MYWKIKKSSNIISNIYGGQSEIDDDDVTEENKEIKYSKAFVYFAEHSVGLERKRDTAIELMLLKNFPNAAVKQNNNVF